MQVGREFRPSKNGCTHSPKSNSSTRRYFCAPLLALSFFLAQTLDAYEVPLSPSSVEEAYVLGQRNDRATAEFVAPYIKQVTEEGDDGPHRADIQVLTPYSQVVDQSRTNTEGYTKEQAAKDYHERGDTVVVRITLELPASYPRQSKE